LPVSVWGIVLAIKLLFDRSGNKRKRKKAVNKVFILSASLAFVACPFVLSPLFDTLVIDRLARDSRQYDLSGGIPYSTGSTLEVRGDKKALVVSGAAGREGAGYFIQPPDTALAGKKKITVKIAGVSKTDRFDKEKLFKLEINDKTVPTETEGMANKSDATFVNAANGECVFYINSFDEIYKLDFVFINCDVKQIKLSLFVE
jgi:hypothetical protein